MITDVGENPSSIHQMSAGPGGGTLADRLVLLTLIHTPSHLNIRYLLTKRLGDGTFGEVVLAKKIDTGDKVAVKR